MEDVFAYPVPRTTPFGPPAGYDERRAQKPFDKVDLFSGERAWMVTKLADAKAFLDSPSVSTNKLDPRYPKTRINLTFSPQAERPITTLDGEVHRKLRRLLAPEFSMKRIMAMRPQLEEVVDTILDEFIAGGGPADLVEGVCLPIASSVISIMLGVPYQDSGFFQEQSARLLKRHQPREDFLDAQRQLTEYMARLVASKSERPDDAVISRLYRRVASGELPEAQLVSFAFTMLLAGHETTANMMALGVLTFLEQPDKLREVQDDPTLMPAAVIEMLRYHSILDDITSRFLVEDAVIAGREVKADDKVCISSVAANYDPEAFESPHELNFHRNGQDNVAFGYGPHQCLGQNLARAELEIGYRAIFERLPGLRLETPLDQLPFKSDGISYGLYEMKVDW